MTDIPETTDIEALSACPVESLVSVLDVNKPLYLSDISNGISDGPLICVKNNSHQADAKGLFTNRFVSTEPENDTVVTQIDLPENKTKDNQNEQHLFCSDVSISDEQEDSTRGIEPTKGSEGTNELEGENRENLINIVSSEEKSVMTDSIRRSERNRQPPQ